MSRAILIEFTDKFPERLRQVRTENGLKQAEIAEKIYVSQESISQYERGLIVPTSDVFSRLGQALGVSLDWLAGLTDDRKVHQKRKPKME